MMESNIRYHLRHLVNEWKCIKKLKELSGVGWDEKEKKKIVMRKEEYEIYVQANSKDEPFINKPIEDYDLLAIVCDNNYVTRYFAKELTDPLGGGLGGSSISINDEPFGYHSRPSEDYDKESSSIRNEPVQSNSSGKSKNLKRSRDAEIEVMKNVATKIAKVAMALDSSKSRHLADDLYIEVMKLEQEGYNYDDLASVYDYLL
ncbi:uncharacterized protein [Typha angustifolia]|uniref:uncharacterized protein n=1 Tax=Typha angustifolia TaxID=59011 RepID=UPI003C2E83B7